MLLKEKFHSTGDLLLRDIPCGGETLLIAYIDSLSDKLLLEQDIIAPVLKRADEAESLPRGTEEFRLFLLAASSFCQDVTILTFEEGAGKIAEGDIALFRDGCDCAFMFSQRKAEKRSVAEPPTATVLKGPREGFIEEIKTNTALIRRRIKSPDLVFENLSVGRRTATPVTLAYIHGVADPAVVDKVREKLLSVDIDGITDGASLVPFLEERPRSFFKQVGSTEKPDIAAAKLLEGRVAVITDGSPIVLTLPFLLVEDMQDSYDYYAGDWRATFARVFRVLGAALTVLLPAGYVALQSYHFHLLPMKFLITLVGATSSIPFPPAVEGLISSPAVLVTALSSIGIFCVPDQVGTLSVLRLFYLCAAAVLGLFGIIAALLLTLGCLAAMQNYGAPYFAPYAPRIAPDLGDGVFKASPLDMKTRPLSFPNFDRNRQKGGDER